jgi:hypothetical protein
MVWHLERREVGGEDTGEEVGRRRGGGEDMREVHQRGGKGNVERRGGQEECVEKGGGRWIRVVGLKIRRRET